MADSVKGNVLAAFEKVSLNVSASLVGPLASSCS